MLNVKMCGDKWRVVIEKEEWEFSNGEDFRNALEGLILAKENYGRLNRDEKTAYNPTTI